MTEPVAVEIVPRVELGVVRADRPVQLLSVATEAANALAELIESRKLYSTIQGKRFVKCEGWTTLAAMLGCTPQEVGVTEVDGVFTATVELRRLSDGQIVGRASAECGAPDELDRNGKPIWANRPRYARRSMALTRATAKACRLSFSWVMVLAGFEATPQEEMPQDAGVERLKAASRAGAEARSAGLADDEVAGVIQAVGRGQKSTGGTKDATVAPPPADLSQFPPQLAPEGDPLAPGEKLMPMGQHKGAKLGVLSSKVLVAAREWMAKKNAFPDVVQAIDKILTERGGE